MDPIQLIQTTLNGFGLIAGGLEMPNATSSAGIPNATTSNGTPNLSAMSFDLSTILSLLLSFSALRDWLKLIIIGGAIETCRRCCLRLWSTFIESFWITACFEQTDSSYNWILFWLSKHPKWKEARIIDVTTRNFGLHSPAIAVNSEDDDERNGRKLCYLPSFSRTYSLWYKHHYLSVTRTQTHDGLYTNKEVLQIDILARDHRALNNLLLEAKTAYYAAEEHLISIYASESGGSWKHVATRPKRPLKSIVLDPGIKDLLLDDARDFLQSKEWYSERGIPFRRGYLLYGAPGSGKTSMIHSLAGELGLDVFIISLSRIGLDDATLSELISDLPERCIALMEDIDAAFHHGLTRDLDEEEQNATKTPEEREHEKEKEKASVSSPLSRITLSGLLNALDGVSAQEGRILYATTNRYTALDPALCRPGRMDLHVEFKLASRYQAKELFKCFYLPSSEDSSDYSLRRQSGSPSPAPSRSLTPTPPSTPEKQSQFYVGDKHQSNGPVLSKEAVLELADRFADAVPEREFSMASLQGYLMSYKVRPVEAVDDVADWIEKERTEKAKKCKKSQTHIFR